MRDRAILVGQKQSLEIDNLLAQLSDGGRERIILSTEKLNLSL